MNAHARLTMFTVLVVSISMDAPPTRGQQIAPSLSDSLASIYVDATSLHNVKGPTAIRRLFAAVRTTGYYHPERMPWESRKELIAGPTGTVRRESTSLATLLEIKPWQMADDSTAIFLLEETRHLSARDYLMFLRTGSRLLRGYGAVIAVQIPLRSIAKVYALDFVRWMGPLRPEYKYRADQEFRDGHGPWDLVDVRSLVGKRPGFQEDLERLGGTFKVFLGQSYLVWIPPEKIPDVARLWWVESIGQPKRPVVREYGAVSPSDQAPETRPREDQSDP